jgi:DnaJ-domain-containing protein 1
MLEDLTRMDWIILISALALGYGATKFLLIAIRDRSTGIPQTRDPATSSPAWHEVLEVGPDANSEEIKAAYARKVAQYQAGLVSDLGPEFTALAAKKMDEMRRAYEQAIRQQAGP